MRSILYLLLAGLVSTAPQFSTNESGRGCSCNGRLNSGKGECRSEYQGRAFCYVDPGRCSDQVASSTQGQWWSHNACQTRVSSQSSEFSPTDESKVNFGQVEGEEKRDDSGRQCICNGLRNSRGEGECKSSYKGRAFCYVARDSCSDEVKSTSSERWWSYQACSTQEKFFSQAPTSNAIGNAVGGIIDEKLKLIGGATNAILNVPLAIGGIINNVLTQGNSGSEFEAVDREEGGEECWCESEQAPLVSVVSDDAASSSVQNRIVNQPVCRDGEVVVCRDQEVPTLPTLPTLPTEPLVQQENEPVCSCNGELNNEHGFQPCESSFRGAPWCYVEQGRCRDGITSDTTGKTWSQDACRVGNRANNNKETNGVNPIVPRLQLQLE